MASIKARRVNLPLKRKIDLIRSVEAGGKRKKDIASEFGICAGTISHIMKDKERLKQLYHSGEIDPRKQRQRSAQHDDIDGVLLHWFKVTRGNTIPISGPVMKVKAEEFAKELGFPEWTCSEGWLNRFNTRHNINFRKVA